MQTIKGLSREALLMMSNNYRITLHQPDLPSPYRWEDLGVCRVVGVAISESGSPELLLKTSASLDPQYYPLERLIVNEQLPSNDSCNICA